MKVLTGVVTGSIALIVISLSVVYLSSPKKRSQMETASIPVDFPSRSCVWYAYGLEFDINLNSDKYKRMTEAVTESLFCHSALRIRWE